MCTITLVRRCGYIIVLSGIIILIIGALSIPDQMPTISQQNEETPQEASDRVSREHNQTIIRSKGFLLTMIGTGLACLGILCIIILRCFDESDYEIRVRPEPLKSALKVTVSKPIVSEIQSSLEANIDPAPLPQAIPHIYSKPRPHITMIKFPHKNEAIDHIL